MTRRFHSAMSTLSSLSKMSQTIPGREYAHMPNPNGIPYVKTPIAKFFVEDEREEVNVPIFKGVEHFVGRFLIDQTWRPSWRSLRGLKITFSCPTDSGQHMDASYI